MGVAYVLAIAVLLAALGAAPGWAQSACPSGYRYQSAQGNCLSTVAPICPSASYLSASGTLCIDDVAQRTRTPSCPAGHQFRIDRGRGHCTSQRRASCPTGQRVNPRSGQCVTGRAG